MKLKSLLLSVGLGMSSCANQDQGFSISKFYPLAPGCDISANVKDTIAGNGFLDVAAGSPQYFVGILISGAQNVEQRPVEVGNVLLERANRNRPLVNQQIVNYRLSKRVGPAPKPYITNISLPFSEEGTIFGAFQLISPELGTALDSLNPSSGTAPSTTIEDFVDISVDVEFKGEFSATKNPFTTGVLTFPIRAYKSLAVACPNGPSGAPLPYVKLATDTSTGAIDACSYVGQSVSQLSQPPSPPCCSQLGPMGGGGC